MQGQARIKIQQLLATTPYPMARVAVLQQREYVLRQQLEQIRRDLGETDDRDAEIAELRRRLGEANLPEDARREAEREIGRLERMPPGAAEYMVTRTYLDWLLDLPWNTRHPRQPGSSPGPRSAGRRSLLNR